MALVTLTNAKLHLRIDYDELDADITLKLAQAEGIIVDRINVSERGRTLTAAWDELTVPVVVQAAILLMLAHLWENRGDGSGGTIGGGQPDQNIWKAVDLFLTRYLDSAVV
jgi:hypothetical protein